MVTSRIDAYHQQLIDAQKNKPAARIFPVGTAPAEEDQAAEDKETAPEVAAKVVRGPKRKEPTTTEAETA